MHKLISNKQKHLYITTDVFVYDIEIFLGILSD